MSAPDVPVTLPGVRMPDQRFRSIFAPSRGRERRENFEAYWAYTLARDGAILEEERDLAAKKTLMARFRTQPVRTRVPRT